MFSGGGLRVLCALFVCSHERIARVLSTVVETMKFTTQRHSESDKEKT